METAITWKDTRAARAIATRPSARSVRGSARNNRAITGITSLRCIGIKINACFSAKTKRMLFRLAIYEGSSENISLATSQLQKLARRLASDKEERTRTCAFAQETTNALRKVTTRARVTRRSVTIRKRIYSMTKSYARITGTCINGMHQRTPRIQSRMISAAGDARLNFCKLNARHSGPHDINFSHCSHSN